MKLKRIFFATATLFICLACCLSCNQIPPREQINNYKLITLQKSSQSLQTSYSASIKGRQDVAIYPQVSGYLTDVHITEGSSVREGQTLFVIDQVPYEVALQGAKANVAINEANVATAKLSYQSKQNLYQKSIISEFELITVENGLKTAKAQLALAQSQEKSAQTNLSYTLIKSPSDGVVGKIPYRKGTLVSPSLPNNLTIVSDNSEMYVYFSMTENQILDLIGEYKSLDNAIANMPEVNLQLNNRAIYEQVGSIESISGVIEENTGAVSIRAVFPNSEKQLLSGGSGNIIMPYERDNVIVIPIDATYEVQNKVYVFKVIDGKAQSTIVELAKINNGKEYIVESGLEQGDVIIASGAGLVREGVVVNQKR